MKASLSSLAFLLALVPAALHLGCGGGEEGATTGDAGPDAPEPLPGTRLLAEPQRPGDPDRGYTALVNEGYVSCGIPVTAYDLAAGPAPEDQRLPGRTGRNAELPYFYTAFTTKGGVEVVAPNCLVCHASRIAGELVVGLGASDGDYTSDAAAQIAPAAFVLTDPEEQAEFRKFEGRVKAFAPFIKTTTVGPNPADNLAAALFAHHDQETLAWSDEPLMALPPEHVIPVDVPPWWRMAKKNAMFYVGGGRGDHARIMMTASTFCTDSVEEAQAIDAYFPDVRAFIASIPPPRFPFAIDAARAEQGKVVFEATCARCHGTHGDGGVYPNLAIPLAEVATDAQLATGSTQFASEYVDWFNGSFYGELSRLEPEPGYVAPPLDGVWATAPFLHNGSVPTIAALLDSTTRPAAWTRSFDSNDYDPAALGWIHTTVPGGKAAEPDASARKRIYDTTEPGYANTGHRYGDTLTPEERASVLEYLKTL